MKQTIEEVNLGNRKILFASNNRGKYDELVDDFKAVRN